MLREYLSVAVPAVVSSQCPVKWLRGCGGDCQCCWPSWWDSGSGNIQSFTTPVKPVCMIVLHNVCVCVRARARVLPWRECCGRVLHWCRWGKVQHSLLASARIDWYRCLAWSGTPTKQRNWSIYTQILPCRKCFIMFLGLKRKVSTVNVWITESSICPVCMSVNQKSFLNDFN